MRPSRRRRELETKELRLRVRGASVGVAQPADLISLMLYLGIRLGDSLFQILIYGQCDGLFGF